MNKTTKTFTYIIGIIMTIAMVGSLILPMLTSNIGQTDVLAGTPAPTPLPEPTLPPPPDTAAIDFGSRHLHASGLFTFSAPTGWLPATSSNTADELRAGLSNNELLSAIEVRINKNHAGLADAAALSEFFDKNWLAYSWAGYTGWDETARRILDEGSVRIDFNISRGRSRLIARQESWFNNNDIYSARVVMAENAAQELKFLLKGVADSVRWLPIYADPPFDWNAYFDNKDKHMLRYPANWQVTDAQAGLPATIEGDGVTLVVSTFDVALANEAEALAWLENWRSGLEVRAVEALEVAEAAGFKAAYRLVTLDGAVQSGLAIMLHGTDNRLHVANLRVNDLDENLLAPPADEEAGANLWRAVIDSFRLLPELEVSQQ